jgi:predicted RNase H-like HicB family nuclease
VTITVHIEYDREEDGRWVAEVPSLPGVMAYGTTKRLAMKAAKALAVEVLPQPPLQQ